MIFFGKKARVNSIHIFFAGEQQINHQPGLQTAAHQHTHMATHQQASHSRSLDLAFGCVHEVCVCLGPLVKQRPLPFSTHDVGKKNTLDFEMIFKKQKGPLPFVSREFKDGFDLL